jgi:hypothetical protein
MGENVHYGEERIIPFTFTEVTRDTGMGRTITRCNVTGYASTESI